MKLVTILAVTIALLLAGCSAQKQVTIKQTAKPRTVWIAEKALNRSSNTDPDVLAPQLAYKGYVYVHQSPRGINAKPDLNRYIADYDGFELFTSKDDSNDPPLLLWARSKTKKRHDDTDSPFPFKRWRKGGKNQPQILRSTKTNEGLRLSFELPEQDFKAGIEYIAKVTLTNLTDKDAIFNTAYLYEVSIVDENDKLVWETPPAGVAGDYRVGFAPGVPYGTYVRFAVSEPGTYKIYCRMATGRWHHFGPGTSEKVPDVKAGPIEITVN